MEVEEWFKECNKERVKEIENLCVKISAQWPLAALSEEEKKSAFDKIFLSEDFQMLKDEIEEIGLKTPFSSSGNFGALALLQIIAAESITKRH